MFDQPVVVIDTETTSLDPYNRVVWEIGMVKINPDGTTVSKDFQIELNQREIDRANPESLEIGGFDERYNELEALSRRTVANYVRDFTEGCIIANFAVDFDVRNLTDLLHSYDLQPAWDYHLLDLRSLFVGYLTAKGHERGFLDWDQDAFADEFGVATIEEGNRHTALGDAEYAAAMLEAVIRGD